MQVLTAQECADKIRNATRVVAMTGAGVSTAAGIPDFRGPKGLYVTRAYDPDTVFDISRFDRSPEEFYRFTHDLFHVIDTLKPTFTHGFLAELERRGKLRCLITQNIDPLHQLAGSRKVIPIHGNYATSRCRICRQGFDLNWFRGKLAETEVVRCDECGGLVKPDVVFFGEMVNGLDEAENAVMGCDLLLVLGSSLTVYPAAGLAQIRHADVCIVNKGRVNLPPQSNRYYADTDLDSFFTDVFGLIGLND